MTAPGQKATDQLKAAAQNVYDSTSVPAAAPGRYVAVSGNTAAGKTTLIDTVAETLRGEGLDAIGVSERVFHHPYLKLMFSAAEQFAFPIQLSFMLERHMVLLDNLVRRGRTTVMERSHLDDPMFVREHVLTGSITAEQEQAYLAVSAQLCSRIPVPDVVVLMNPEPELSLRRLARAESEGSRPREFPTEEAKHAWVHRWYALYRELHDDFRRRATDGDLRGTRLVELDAASPIESRIAAVLAAVRAGGGRG